jgi:hypothetical protein
MMKRTSHGLAHHHPFGERAPVMRARGAHGMKREPAPRHEHGLPFEVSDRDPAVWDCVRINPQS